MQRLCARWRYRIFSRPLVTAGVAWHTDLVTLTADGDLTETPSAMRRDCR
jgi:hypothetical protein